MSDRHGLALLTDLYELNMLYAHWQAGTAQHAATFDLFFRRGPGGYLVAAGLQSAVEYLQNLNFTADDLAYLKATCGYSDAFLDELAALRFSGDLAAVPEGTPVFPGEPVLRLTAPLLQAQLAETALLNLVSFESLVATKAARVVQAAAGGAVMEFGARRAHGPDAAVLGARAAVLAGCAGTSNVLTGHRFGAAVSGTMAHAFVQAFPSELEAFRAYARTFPDSCLLLVDTYDTLASGVPNAISVGRELAAQGHRLLGIRLDSGDLAALSREARRLLDAAGLTDAKIVASGDLDEHAILSLRRRGARIDLWGVGTRLITGGEPPYLGGVYKLAAVAADGGALAGRIKVSEDAAKTTLPGVKQLWRLYRGESAVADLLALADEDVPAMLASGSIVHNLAEGATRLQGLTARPLLAPVLSGGRLAGALPGLKEAQAAHRRRLAELPGGVRDLERPAAYPLYLTPSLWRLRRQLLLSARAEGAHV